MLLGSRGNVCGGGQHSVQESDSLALEAVTPSGILERILQNFLLDDSRANRLLGRRDMHNAGKAADTA